MKEILQNPAFRPSSKSKLKYILDNAGSSYGCNQLIQMIRYSTVSVPVGGPYLFKKHVHKMWFNDDSRFFHLKVLDKYQELVVSLTCHNYNYYRYRSLNRQFLSMLRIRIQTWSDSLNFAGYGTKSWACQSYPYPRLNQDLFGIKICIMFAN
jgi:hypothetical protein